MHWKKVLYANQLYPTKSQVELEDNFIVCFVENMIYGVCGQG